MGTPTLKLNKALIEAIEPPEKGRDLYRDSERRHLYLFVTPTRRVFYYIRKVKGRTLQEKIGAFPDTTVALARREADKFSGMIAEGLDLRAVRRHAEAVQTFGDLFTRYMEDYAKPHSKTWPESERKHRKHFLHWDARRLQDITTSDVTRMHKKLGREHGPYLANRTVELIRAVFNFGIRQKLTGENPATGVDRFDEKERERFLNAEELRRLFAALEQEENPLVRDFITISLWTGARRGNVQAMRWSDLDLAEAIWTVPGVQMKNGDLMRVALSPPALEILKRRKVENESPRTIRDKPAPPRDSPYVFPARTYRSKTGHLTDPKRGWTRLLERSGLKDVRVHDLRRTLGSWQAAQGASLQVIGKSLGHKTTRATEIYARLNLDPVRASVNAATEAMLRAVNGEA